MNNKKARSKYFFRLLFDMLEIVGNDGCSKHIQNMLHTVHFNFIAVHCKINSKYVIKTIAIYKYQINTRIKEEIGKLEDTN